MDHLPSRYHDPDLFMLIQVISFLTVRIDVSYTSNRRPMYNEGTTCPYPFSKERGQKGQRTGTGRIGMVWRYTEKDNRTCICSACKNSPTPKREWGLIRIITAVHVVYDKEEALHAVSRFGYNSEHSPGVILEGVDMERADVTDDRCHLSCVTHDLQLLDQMRQNWSRYPPLHAKLCKKFDTPEDKLTVIVSHPHGCIKYISLGEWAKREERGESSPGHPYAVYTYNAPTCPGSSGATVYIMGRKWGLWYNQIHRGYNGMDNFSGNGCD